MSFSSATKAGAVGALAHGAREMLSALLAIPLLLLLAWVLLQYGGRVLAGFGADGPVSLYAVAGVLAFAVGWLFVAVVRRRKPFNAFGFLACSLTSAVVVYYAYISSIDVAWVSDFAGMWRTAVDMVSSGSYAVHSIYNERALPVLVPAILLFGADRAIVPIVNLVLLLAVQLAGYDLARRIAGHRAAQGFVVLWLGAMEPIWALNITSHDIWGLFFLVAFLWGFRVTFERVRAGKSTATGDRLILAVCVLGLALALTLLDMQRELTPIVILGFALAGALLALKGVGRRIRLGQAALLAVTAFLLYAGMAAGLRHSGYMLTAEQGQRLANIRIGAYGSTLSDGTYAQGQVIAQSFFTQIEGAALQDLVYSIPLSDLTLQPAARIGDVVARSQKQALLGSQTYFYQAEASTHWDWLVPLTRTYNICFSIVLGALSLWLIVPLLRRLDSFDGLAQLSVLSALVGLLLLVGESQPRYIFPLWFILPQLVAFSLTARSGIVDRPPVTSVWGWDMTRGALLLFAAYLLLALTIRGVYGESSGRVLSGWTVSLSGATEPVPEDWVKDSQKLAAVDFTRNGSKQSASGFGDLALVMKFPITVPAGSKVIARKRLCVGEDRRALSFFYFMPYQNSEAKGAFTLDVVVDGRRRWSAPLPGTATATHVRIAQIMPANECGSLKIILHANRRLVRKSWVNASHTDVYFMRLVH